MSEEKEERCWCMDHWNVTCDLHGGPAVPTGYVAVVQPMLNDPEFAGETNAEREGALMAEVRRQADIAAKLQATIVAMEEEEERAADSHRRIWEILTARAETAEAKLAALKWRPIAEMKSFESDGVRIGSRVDERWCVAPYLAYRRDVVPRCYTHFCRMPLPPPPEADHA